MGCQTMGYAVSTGKGPGWRRQEISQKYERKRKRMTVLRSIASANAGGDYKNAFRNFRLPSEKACRGTSADGCREGKSMNQGAGKRDRSAERG